MKTLKTILIGILILIISALSVGFFLFTKKERIEQNKLFENQKNQLINIINDRDSIINEWILTYNQIEKDVEKIKEKENYLNQNKLRSNNNELTIDQKTKLIQDINYLSSLIDYNRKKIFNLNEKLKLSGNMILGLEQKINTLDSILLQNKLEITTLKNVLTKQGTEISKLNSNVDSLTTTVKEKEIVIDNQIKEKNKAYLITGTFKGLESKGVLTKVGGFIGIGKNKTLSPNLNDSSFVVVDITKLNIIPIGAKSVKLISKHPSGSYKIVYENKNYISHIEILDHLEFWKFSKYCVVETK